MNKVKQRHSESVRNDVEEGRIAGTHVVLLCGSTGRGGIGNPPCHKVGVEGIKGTDNSCCGDRKQ